MTLEDRQIIELYWARSENAIGETDRKYGGYLSTIAYNILYNREDASEAVNDTFVPGTVCLPRGQMSSQLS